MSSGFRLPVGTRVRLSGLQSRPELNGCTGMVFDYKKERYHVRLDADLLQPRTLLPANLQIISLPLRGESAPEASHAEDEADHSVDADAPEAGEEAGEEDILTEVESAMSDGDEVVEAVGGGRKRGRRAMLAAHSDSEGDTLPDELEPAAAAAWPAAAAWLRPGRSGDCEESPVELSEPLYRPCISPASPIYLNYISRLRQATPAGDKTLVYSYFKGGLDVAEARCRA